MLVTDEPMERALEEHVMNAVRELRIIVTGAGRGLGKAMAEGLAAGGARVIVAGRTASDVDNVAAGIREAGGAASAVCFDAIQDEDCRKPVETAVTAYGGVDCIIINHGITHHADALSTSPAKFRQVVDINLSSAFICAQVAARQMIAQGAGGSVIFISSTASLLAFDGLSAYSASKGGIDQLTRQLAFEWARYGIRVNSIAPGYMNTHMRGVEAEYETQQFKNTLATKIPLGRRGEPHELVGAASLFASSASSYITGQQLVVDGGYGLL